MSHRMDDEEYDAYHREYEYFADIIDDLKEDAKDDIKDAVVHPLGSTTANPSSSSGSKVTGWIGITVNYPHTKSFLNMTRAKQKALYTKLWHLVKCTLGLPQVSEFVFEECKDGVIHMHGYISMHTVGFIMGALSDLSKAILKCLPTKYSDFKTSFCYPDYCRIRTASHCLQYYESSATGEGIDTINHWKKYIKKHQP